MSFHLSKKTLFRRIKYRLCSALARVDAPQKCRFSLRECGTHFVDGFVAVLEGGRSIDDSAINIFVVTADEEMRIARDTAALVSGEDVR